MCYLNPATKAGDTITVSGPRIGGPPTLTLPPSLVDNACPDSI